ncbi:MAG: ABC transporter permease [Treponema sp. GWB1_62_6]|nr:MAG: ABC transporter permease [Treponema sp. GWA1_62_8]OHE65310.1 MAG: ABC transporter permease [Treponema sp. GWB1_62_6]OHE67451.1 MAG: ABC transporter permease [Treponema sp. GWC1_61_84]OHE76757.1 MAG: ABC transporter permease [Treponema sp. RIFOXYC1_FULL_61_9]HCM28393.1 ABC transporter permease [Treponema sp.]
MVGRPESKRKALWTAGGTVLVLAVWTLAARAVGSELILPSPLAVFRSLLFLSFSAKFLPAVLGSMARVALSLSLAVPAALAVGLLAGLDSRFRAFVKPFFAIVGATPVLSIILIALLWFGQEGTPVFAAFLMVFPVAAQSVIAGVASADTRLLEACEAYGLTRIERIRHLYLPSLTPYLLAGFRSGLSLCWKVVVAAEVLAQPARSLGARMQSAKAQLETTELFAWTAATVILAAATDGLFAVVLRAGSRHGIVPPAFKGARDAA